MYQGRSIQTSVSHPLVVDEVAAHILAPLPGRVGMSIAPGKKDLNGHTAPHDRDLTADLDALFTQFPATVFVSLMEAFEYSRFKIAALFPEVRARGAQVIHYPIVDVSVPKTQTSFCVLVEQLHEHVARGEAVYVHCKGGYGRTGLVVASLLVRCGYSSEEAMRLTRATRTGTIQTTAQERWVHTYARKVK